MCECGGGGGEGGHTESEHPVKQTSMFLIQKAYEVVGGEGVT